MGLTSANNHAGFQSAKNATKYWGREEFALSSLLWSLGHLCRCFLQLIVCRGHWARDQLFRRSSRLMFDRFQCPQQLVRLEEPAWRGRQSHLIPLVTSPWLHGRTRSLCGSGGSVLSWLGRRLCVSMVVSSIPGRCTIGQLVLGWVIVFGRAYSLGM